MTSAEYAAKYSLLINVFYFEDVLEKVRKKYWMFNQISYLLILFTMSIKLLVILFIIKLYSFTYEYTYTHFHLGKILFNKK